MVQVRGKSSNQNSDEMFFLKSSNAIIEYARDLQDGKISSSEEKEKKEQANRDALSDNQRKIID